VQLRGMDVVANLEYARSLEATWRAYRTSRSIAQPLVETRTSVVCDLLNARYYDSTRGQFLSQDPIFLSSSQNFGDPQSLNSYSYSEGNPINKSDPTGKATYIWSNGAGMSGIDTWNTGTYYENADNSMLQADAAQMHAEGPVGGLADFTMLNWPGSTWDYKSKANQSSG